MSECNVFDILEQVIDDRFRINNPGSKLELIEEQNLRNREGTEKGVNIVFRNTGKCFAFSLDVPGLDPFPIFKPREGVKQKNDAIIYFERNQKKYCFIIELKSNKYNKAYPQLQSGKDFMEYLFAILDKNCGVSVKDVEFKFIIFTTSPPAGGARKISSRKEKVTFLNRQGIDVAVTSCNRAYSFENFI
ncbi:hypothetical protein [Bacillus paranthracis]